MIIVPLYLFSIFSAGLNESESNESNKEIRGAILARGATVSYQKTKSAIEYHVSIDGKDGIEKTLAIAKRLRNVTVVSLTNPRVRNEGVDAIESFTSLRHLTLKGNLFDDFAADVAGRIYQLESIDLSATSVTNRGAVKLKRLKKLRYLRLANTRITQGGCAWLKNLADSLDTLDLGGTRIVDSDCKSIAAAPKIRYLNVSMTGITDDGVNDLAGLVKMEGINLNGTAITEKSLVVLGKWPHLREAKLACTNIPFADIKRFLKESSVSIVTVDKSTMKDLSAVNKDGRRVLVLYETRNDGK
ncbi:MAG: hypothetical protein H8E37_08900 [Planctomycetes bacterium]|nr:hypothetical protein [Planctomycetota bacterium]